MIARYKRGDGANVPRFTYAAYAGVLSSEKGLLALTATGSLSAASGSPVVNEGGTVVGMVVARLRDRPRTAVVVDVFTLTGFMASAGVAPETVRASPNSTGKSPIDALRRYTFLTRCLQAEGRGAPEVSAK